MKLSNRVLGFLLLFSIIGAFYIFIQVFFKIKLTSLEINSNIENFSGSLENIKFSKDFFCEKKKCLINDIPPFEYTISINKKNYKNYKTKINLFSKNKLDIFLEKEIYFKKIEEKISKRKLILELIKNKINFGNIIYNYSEIYGTNKYVYFKIKNGSKLNFYNFKNNNSFNINFKPKINYIKKIKNNLYIINTKNGSFSFNPLDKKIEYFSLFSDFVISGNIIIGIINNEEKVRKKNFDLDNIDGNLIIIYNRETKKSYILKNLNNKISKIYFEEEKLFIENKIGEKFEITGY